MGTEEGPEILRGEELALAVGVRRTRGALVRWARDPAPILTDWLLGATAIALILLAAVSVVAVISTPDSTPLGVPGVGFAPDASDFGYIFGNNLIVLALHATACVAGFIAGSSIPLAAASRTGLNRIIHERAARIAILWVILVTAFSLVAQALALGFLGATLAAQLDIGVGLLVLSVLPHALPELVAIFLPLAAWLIASRRDEWQDLLAATLVTVAIAVPVLVVATLVELYVWPELLQIFSPVL